MVDTFLSPKAYRSAITRRGTAAWPHLVRALSEDLARNEDSLAPLRQLAPLRDVRLADIAIWMEGRR